MKGIEPQILLATQISEMLYDHTCRRRVARRNREVSWLNFLDCCCFGLDKKGVISSKQTLLRTVFASLI